MKFTFEMSLAEVVFSLVIAIVSIATVYVNGIHDGFTARNGEVDGLRRDYREAAAVKPEWIDGTDKQYGPFSIVTFDHGKNYYAAVRRDEQVLIINRVENVYPGLLARLETPPVGTTAHEIYKKKSGLYLRCFCGLMNSERCSEFCIFITAQQGRERCHPLLFSSA